MKELYNLNLDPETRRSYAGMPKSLLFLLSITMTITNSAWNFHVRLNVSMPARIFFACAYGWTCVYTDRVLYSQHFNYPKSRGWYSVPKLRLTGVPNSFHDFSNICFQSFVKIISITIIFLPVTFYLFCFYTLHINIRILIDSATASSRFPKSELKRQNFL